MGQISGALFVLIFETVNASTGSPVAPMIGLVILTAIEIPMVLAMRESSLIEKAKGYLVGNDKK